MGVVGVNVSEAVVVCRRGRLLVLLCLSDVVVVLLGVGGVVAEVGGG